jgi:hypothetical protein
MQGLPTRVPLRIAGCSPDLSVAKSSSDRGKDFGSTSASGWADYGAQKAGSLIRPADSQISMRSE